MADLDLRSVQARLDWAVAHAQRVQDLALEWSPTALRTTTTPDPDAGLVVYRAEVVGEPPVSIALALGDALHQARAALDSLVAVLRGGATKMSTYRIDTDPDVFDKDEDGRLEGVPTWAVAAIRDVQPFPKNDLRIIGETIAQLHALAIVDRHRALLVAAALIDVDQTWATTSHPGDRGFELHDGGRMLTLRYPAGAVVTPTTAINVIVRESAVRWRGESDRYPHYPAAAAVARNVVWAVEQAIQKVRTAATAAGLGLR